MRRQTCDFLQATLRVIHSLAFLYLLIKNLHCKYRIKNNVSNRLYTEGAQVEELRKEENFMQRLTLPGRSLEICRNEWPNQLYCRFAGSGNFIKMFTSCQTANFNDSWESFHILSERGYMAFKRCYQVEFSSTPTSVRPDFTFADGSLFLYIPLWQQSRRGIFLTMHSRCQILLISKILISPVYSFNIANPSNTSNIFIFELLCYKVFFVRPSIIQQ